VSITARILLGSLVLSIAGVLLFLSLVSKRVGQAYREAVEEPMVDTAEVIAGVIANEIETTGSFSDSWERGFQTANQRTLHAQVYSLLKTRISTASSATNMRSSAVEYPTPGWVSFQSATRVSFALAATAVLLPLNA